MPYRKTNSLSSGRREEREKQLNTHRPIESGIAALCQRVRNHYTTTDHIYCNVNQGVAQLYAGSWYSQRVRNHYNTASHFCCIAIKGTTSTTHWLPCYKELYQGSHSETDIVAQLAKNLFHLKKELRFKISTIQNSKGRVILSAPHSDGDEESHPLKKRNRSFVGKAYAGPSQDDKLLIQNCECSIRSGVVIW